VGLLERLDRIDDDLSEERWQWLIGVLVPRPRPETAEAVAVPQVVDRLPIPQHAELVLPEALQVVAVARADAILGRRSGVPPRWEAEPFRPGVAGSASGVGPLGKGLRTALMGAGDPLLDGADTTPRA
jgi:hypothetical protein